MMHKLIAVALAASATTAVIPAWSATLSKPRVFRLELSRDARYSIIVGLTPRHVLLAWTEPLSKRSGRGPLSAIPEGYYAGFGCKRHASVECRTRDCMLMLPLWAVTVLLTAYPVMVVIRTPFRRHVRRRRGLCVSCGYDLTGNETGGCPECGIHIDRR